MVRTCLIVGRRVVRSLLWAADRCSDQGMGFVAMMAEGFPMLSHVHGQLRRIRSTAFQVPQSRNAARGLLHEAMVIVDLPADHCPES